MGGDAITSVAKIDQLGALNELSSCLKKGWAKATQEKKERKEKLLD